MVRSFYIYKISKKNIIKIFNLTTEKKFKYFIHF